MKDISDSQLKLIIDVFDSSKKDKKLIFLKGGWNIDLSYGKVTRPHEDVDFHFNLADKKYWQNWFTKKGFTELPQNDYYSKYVSPEGFSVDVEGFKYEPKTETITWADGGVSKYDEVVEKKEYKGKKFLGMKLSVEKYLKMKKMKDLGKRKRDIHDLEIIEKVTNELRP